MYSKYNFVMLLLISSHIFASTTNHQKTTNEFNNPSIVGGGEVTPFSYPFMGSIQNSRGHFCAGSLIKSNKVLTASHCVIDTEPQEIQVKFGGHNLSVDTQWKVYSVNEIIMHEGFNEDSYDNDVAILVLDDHISDINPIVLASKSVKESLNTDSMLTIMGWGDLEFNGNLSDTLQEVQVPIVDKDTCNSLSYYNGKITDSMLCAGFDAGGKDSCQGDSGGPLIYQYNNQLYQLGIVSWGEECALAKRPGVYADVEVLLDWVYQNGLEFGFEKNQSNLILPNKQEVILPIKFTNTLSKHVTMADVLLSDQTTDVNIKANTCLGENIQSKQICEIEIQLPDNIQSGSFTLSAMMEDDDLPIFKQVFVYELLNQSSIDIASHMSITSNIKWYSGGDATWEASVTDLINAQDTPILVSGNISDALETPSITEMSQKTVLIAEIDNDRINKLSFEHLLSSEEDFDYFDVTHNGQNILHNSGIDNSFQSVDINLAQGRDIIVFQYSKDENTSKGTDSVMLKSIVADYQNTAPIIVLSTKEISVRSEFDFQLDASKSSDLEDDELSFSWVNIEDEETELSKQSILDQVAPKVEEDLVLIYQVTAVDEFGAKASDQVQVNVLKNKSPEAQLSIVKNLFLSGEEVIIEARSSSDPEGDTISFSWLQTSGNTIEYSTSESQLTFIAPDSKTDLTLSFEVTVTDEFGLADSDELTLTIAKNKAPKAQLTINKNSFTTGESVIIDASTSSDPENGILKFAWEQVSGEKVDVTSNTSQLLFTAPDVNNNSSFSFQVTVSDTFDNTDTATISLNVKSKPQPSTDGNESGGAVNLAILLCMLVAIFRQRRGLFKN